jgi:hypothetical protein
MRTGSGGQPNREDPGLAALETARELVRESAQDARTAGVFLLVVLVGVMGQLADGRALVSGPGLVRLPLLLAVIGSFGIAVAQMIRSRVTLLRALAEVRGRIGAPLDPSVRWTPYASRTPLTSEVLDRELRQLVSTAHRCCELAGQAQAWAGVTGLLFVFWTLAWIGA